MPLTTQKRGDKYRVIEADTCRIAKNKAGTAIDGGGKASKAAASRQVNAINISKHKK